MKRFFLLLTASVLLFSCEKTPNDDHQNDYPLGVYNENGVLKHKGDDLYAIGVNYYDLLQKVIDDPNDTGYEQGLKQLSDAKIPFVRFRAGGFAVEDWQKYLEDKDTHFAAFDSVVKKAEELNIGLVPSLFWDFTSVSFLVGEKLDEYGNSESKISEFIETYTREVVQRYKDSPVIWAWEFGNEINLYCDMPVEVFGVQPGQFTEGDMLYGETMVKAYKRFSQIIREYDADRIVITGNHEPRRYIWNNLNGELWKSDTEQQYKEILLRDNPEGIDAISIRGYYACGGEIPPMEIPTFDAFLKKIKPWSVEVGKPIFIGEFGAKTECRYLDENGTTITLTTEESFQSKVDAIVDNRIQLSALWVYDFDDQNEASGNFWNITFSNSRSYQLQAIIDANKNV